MLDKSAASVALKDCGWVGKLIGAILIESGHTTLCLKRFILTLPALLLKVLAPAF